MKPANATRPWHGIESHVRVLAPRGVVSVNGFMDAAAEHVCEPFASARIDAVSRLSSGILRDSLLKQDPASVAAAYWMRKATVVRLKARYEQRSLAEPTVVRVPVGRVFHVAPSNVDTLFVYSWVLSFLCGNANLVRVSQQQSPVVEALLRVISAVADEDAGLRESNCFVTYEHDATVTAALSAWCGHRIIWGGDETIAALRPLALSSHASERLFGSKFSYAVVSAERFLASTDDELTRLAGAFFNDLFWFDQMACSSPHIVFWVGDETRTAAAVSEFSRRLQEEVSRRAYVPAMSAAVRRMVYAFGLAADADVRVHLEHPGFVAIRVQDARILDKDTCGGGLIRHARLDRLEELDGFATEADQTVTHFGLSRDELLKMAARLGMRGVDRIVPVGQALAFDVVWDGHDLLEDLVRKVTVAS